MCNSPPEVAPYGGRARKLGTNPICFAVPANKEKPIILDMATSVVAAGKIRAKYAAGEKLPEGWIIDNEGKSTVDPRVFLSGAGMLLPLGGYKGFGLSVIIDLLGGALTGTGCTSTDFKGGNGTIMLAINISSFTPVKEFKERVDNLVRSLKSTPTAPGFKEILMPGEPELLEKERRLREGIEISDLTWQNIEVLAKTLKVTISP